MEEYKVDSSDLNKKNESIKLGFYYDKVYHKHLDSYGEFGAGNIRDNIMPTFNRFIFLRLKKGAHHS